MDFGSDEWLDALDRAAQARDTGDDDALGDLRFCLEQEIEGGPAWRLVIDRGSCRVRRSADDDPPANVRLGATAQTAEAIARGDRSALDAFIAGDLRLGGDAEALLAAKDALETLGDLFAAVRAETFADG